MQRSALKKWGLICFALATLILAGQCYTKHKTEQNLAIYLLRSLPISSTLIGPPKGYIFAEEYKQKYPDRYKTVLPSEEVTIASFPLNATHPTQILHFPEVFVLEIENGRIAKGISITENDRIIADTAVTWKQIEKHPIFREWKLPRLKKKNNRIAIISSKSGEYNYFHWMFDVLPKLEVLERSQIAYDKIYLNSLDQPFQIETLQRLGINLRDLIWADVHIEAENLIVPSLPGQCGMVPKFACDFLRKKLTPTDTPSATKKKIYVSRNDAPTRRIINEDALMEKLKPLGFERVYLQHLTVEEQIRLFASAEWIIAPHGAGLTNLVFCQPHTHVIEIFNQDYVNPCFWIIGQNLNLNYHCLFYPSYNTQRDIVIDVDKITMLFESI